MSGRIVPGLWLIGLVLMLSACGGDKATTGETTETGPTTTYTTPIETAPDVTMRLRVYYLLDGKVQPVARDVPKTQAVARVALNELFKGPTTTERELGMTSLAGDGGGVSGLAIADGVATLAVPAVDRGGLAQIVYTLTQFPTVDAVEVDGRRYSRADLEDETPIILVESPLPFETVGSPLRATGTANAFEATFQYEVVGPEGEVVDSTFVTATSGSGQRGTFDFTTQPYEISGPGQGALVVFELSAEDGSRIHEVRIPVEMGE